MRAHIDLLTIDISGAHGKSEAKEIEKVEQEEQEEDMTSQSSLGFNIKQIDIRSMCENSKRPRLETDPIAYTRFEDARSKPKRKRSRRTRRPHRR